MGVKRQVAMLAASTGLMFGLGAVLATGPASAAPARTEVAMTAQVAPLAQEVYLGAEFDKCSGSLSVKDRYGVYQPIVRGQLTTIDVAIDGGNYWYWKCGSSGERSRGSDRVKRLKIWHSTEGRSITWYTYDLLP